MSRSSTLWPSFAGGVWGSVKQNSPSSAEAAAATWNCSATASAPSVLMATPATIHPIVPSTRTPGNSLPGSFIWWKDSELVSDSVGMKQSV